jgi:hypothetical protein
MKMGRWWNSDRLELIGLACKSSLAAGSVAALLLVAACGDKEEAQQQSGEASESAAPAAAIDPAQAPLIQKAIEDYLQLAEGPAEERVLHHGAVKVTPEADAFEVTIEGVFVGLKDGDRLDVGTIGYRLTPKADGFVASNLTHANQIPARDKDGKETGSLSITTKSFGGEWSSSLQTFLSFDWQAVDIAAKDNAADGGNIAAKTMTTTLTSADKGNGLFDQSGRFELTEFTVKEQGGGEFKLGKLDFTGAMSAVRLKEYVAKTREMQAMMAGLADKAAKSAAEGEAAASQAAAPAALSAEEAAKFGGMIKSLSGLLGGLKYDVTLSDASFKEQDGSEPFHLGQGALAASFAGLDQEKAAVNLAISHDKLAIKDPDLAGDPLFAKLLPASGKLDLNLTDVPSKELWQLVGDNFPNLVAGDPAQSDAAAGVMLIAMQQLLQKAPMKLTVAPSGLTSEVMQLDATGSFDVKPDATLGLVGALDVALHGLDEAMKLANDAAQSSPSAAQIVGGLAMIQSMAKREAGSDGKPVDKLKLEVDAAGDTKVNGMSLSGM